MNWQLLLLGLVLGVPLAGAILALLLRRILPGRAAVLIAALALFLAGVAIIILVQTMPPGEELSQLLSPPQNVPTALPPPATSAWVQPPRTLDITATIVLRTPTATPETTPTPTESPTSPAAVRVAVRNGTGETGLASRTADLLEEQGFYVVEVENDRLAGERPHTLILDRGDHPEVRQALADLLNVSPEYIETNSDEPGDVDIIVILGDDLEE